MTTAPPLPMVLPSFQRGDWYHSRDRMLVTTDHALCMTPELDVIAELMQQPVPPDCWAASHRVSVLQKAAALFGGGTLQIGDRVESAAQFGQQLRHAHGIPARLTVQWSSELLEIVNDLVAVPPVDKPISHFISLPANTFLCLEAVYRAVWAGRRVFLRPSWREPWSALRLVAALVAAGMPRQLLTLVNVPHAGLPRLIRFFDEVLLYGGQAVADLQGQLPPHVTVKGPGCSVAVIAKRWTAATVTTTARLVSRAAGRLCTNVRWILVADRTAEFACALAAELGRLERDQNGDCGGGYVLESAAADRSYAALRAALQANDRLIQPLDGDGQPIKAGTRLPSFVAHIAQPAEHPLLRAEPLLPLALVTCGAFEQLSDTFAHSAFAYAVGAGGTVTSLRRDGIAVTRDHAA